MVYVVDRIDNDNLITKKSEYTREFLEANAVRTLDYEVAGRRLGLYYWNSNGAYYLGQFCMQPIYEYQGKQYIYFDKVCDLLTSEHPLNRFSWNDDEDLYGLGELENSPEKMRKIFVES